MVGDPHGEADTTDAAVDERVRAERVRFVIAQSPRSILISPLAGAILAIAIWTVADHARIVVWTAGLAALAGPRVLILRALRPIALTGAGLVRAERWLGASIMAIALWWGLGGLFLLVPDDPTEQVVVFAFLLMMAGGTGSTYPAHPRIVAPAVVAFAAPIAVAFALDGDATHIVLAVAAAMYIGVTFRAFRILAHFFERSHHLAHALELEKEKVEELARIDFLTQIANRRAFREVAEAALLRADRYQRPVSLLVIDLDHFKDVNDRFGHAAGDTALRAVARVIRDVHRATDTSGRLGGEEFGVLLPETSRDEAVEVAERLRARVADQPLAHDDRPIQLTLSVGVAANRDGDTLDDLMARADAALYEAKRAGRNRVIAAEP